MTKFIEAAKRISKALSEDCSSILEEVNLSIIFSPLFHMGYKREMSNSIVCFIIYAYDNDSQWINLKQERTFNKTQILKGLAVDPNNILYKDILANENEDVNIVINDYLLSIINWKWSHLMTQLDSYAQTMRLVNQPETAASVSTKRDKDGNIEKETTEYNVDETLGIKERKMKLLQQALVIRKEADNILAEIRKEYVTTDHAVKSDFGFEITDEQKIDPMSWRDFIRHSYLPRKSKGITA